MKVWAMNYWATQMDGSCWRVLTKHGPLEKRMANRFNILPLRTPWTVSQFRHWVVSDSLQVHALQHPRPPCPSTTLGLYSNSCPWSQWCHPTISSSVVPFSFHLNSFPASGSFPRIQLFTPGGHSIGISASTSVLPVNIQDWFPLGWTGWISLQSKGLSWLFSLITV